MTFSAVDGIIIGISGVAALTDLWKGKIYNWLTLPSLLFGVATLTALHAFDGFTAATAGALLGLVLYGWMFFIGVMGGGDVKLLMALGAWGGPRFAVEVSIFGIIIGAGMALIILTLKGKLKPFLYKLYVSLMSLVVKEMKFQFPTVDRKLNMPFGLAIAAAAVWVRLGHPAEYLGFKIW